MKMLKAVLAREKLTVLAVVVALTVSTASTALAANGGNFILGVLTNTATAITKLTGTVAGPALQVVNPSTGSGATALDLQVAAGKPPMKVNSGTKVTSLNADKVDGNNASDFLSKTGQAADSDKLDGEDSTAFLGANDKAADAAHADRADTAASADSANNATNADKLDNLDSNVFGIATARNWVKSSDCDVVNTFNDCAPVQLVVPPGKSYKVSILSFGTWKGGGFFDSRLRFCSAWRPPEWSAGNCASAAGVIRDTEITLQPGKLTSASSEGEVTLGQGTYILSTTVYPDTATEEAAFSTNVITKVMVRDASAPEPTGLSVP
jgi:hypothetical protein